MMTKKPQQARSVAGKVLGVMCLWSLLGAPPTAGQDLAAAGDGDHLWLAMQDEDAKSLAVYHRAAADAADGVQEVQKLHGRLAPGGLAAADASLWIVYTDGAVQVIDAQWLDAEQSWGYVGGLRPRLPAGVALRGLTASKEGPWALVRTESEPAAPSTQPSDEPGIDPREIAIDIALGLPPGSELSPLRRAAATQPAEAEDENQEKEDGDAPAATAEPPSEEESTVKPTDALLQLHRGRWRVTELPDDWPHTAVAAMTFVREDDERPTLVVRPILKNAPLWVYRWSDGQWNRQDVDMDHTPRFAALGVGGQLVLAQQLEPATADQVKAQLTVLRPSGVNPIGELSLAPPGGVRQWAAAPVESSAAIIALGTADDGADPPLLWARMNLLGQVVAPPQPMELIQPTPLEQQPGFMIQIGVLVLATALIIAFWRRTPGSAMLNLPSDLALADHGRRAVAGLIDVAPGLFIAMVVFSLRPEQIIERWPTSRGPGMTWPGMAPGVVVIGVFLVHVTIGELVFKRSLGKWVMRLRVAAMDGKAPTAAQLVARNLLKTFDLIAWLLLLLPLIGPYRQRLGDMVARTVVVARAPEPEKTEEKDSKDEER